MENVSQEGSVQSVTETPKQYQPTQEEIERTKKVMHDSLASRKPKSFFDSLKEWFR